MVSNPAALATLLHPASGLLPDSRLGREPSGIHWPGGWMVMVYCANCGAEAGLTPGGNGPGGFIFTLCPDCGDQWGPAAHHLVEPHIEFWKKVVAAQLDMYRRVLSADDLVRASDDPHHPLAKLLREGG